MRFTIELARDEGGHVEGSVAQGGEPPVRVSGWLEVMRAMETALSEVEPDAGRDGERRRSETNKEGS